MRDVRREVQIRREILGIMCYGSSDCAGSGIACSPNKELEWKSETKRPDDKVVRREIIAAGDKAGLRQAGTDVMEPR